MSALGQKQTSDWPPLMSALPPKADIRTWPGYAPQGRRRIADQQARDNQRVRRLETQWVEFSRGVERARHSAGKCRSTSSRISPSMCSVVTVGIFSGRGSFRDKFGRANSVLLTQSIRVQK
jgi:hypothetical protein